MAFEAAADSNRPHPPGDEARIRWEESALRHRLLRGQWLEDAQRVLWTFFDDSTLEFLPPPTRMFNAFKEFVEQTSTVYDDPVLLHFRGSDPSGAAIKQLGLQRLWAQQEDTLRNVRGMRESFLRRSWDSEIGEVRYRVVAPDSIDAFSTGNDPQQPTVVWELRKRRGIISEGFDPRREYWCWDVWDFSTPGRESFSILFDQGPKQEDADLIDLTLEIMPELFDLPGRVPYWSEFTDDGAPAPDAVPVWPWTAYHHRVSSRMFTPFEGVELVDGTLILAVLWTYWVGGFRDVAFAARWLMDCDVAGQKVDSKSGQTHVALNPMMIAKLRSLGEEKPGQVGQWDAPMDPLKAAEAISNVAASLGQSVGLSQSDVSVGNQGLSRVSGMAIEVSRKGVRRVEGQVITPLMISDQHNLAGAGQMANAYGTRAALPTEPAAYQPVYSRKGQTADEVRQDVDQAVLLVENNLLDPRDAVVRMHPEKTREQAEQYLIELAEFNRKLTSLRGPATAAALDEDPSDDDEPEGPAEEPGEAE